MDSDLRKEYYESVEGMFDALTIQGLVRALHDCNILKNRFALQLGLPYGPATSELLASGMSGDSDTDPFLAGMILSEGRKLYLFEKLKGEDDEANTD